MQVEEGIFKALDPQEFIQKSLNSQTRADRRDFNEKRSFTLNQNPIKRLAGSSTCRLGNTTIVCGIKGELTTPSPSAPTEGFFVPNIELTQIAGSEFKQVPGEFSQSNAEYLNELILKSNLLNLNELLITKSLCWVLYCDFVCLSYDGNLIDCLLGALMGALKTLRLPVIKIGDDDEKIVTDEFFKPTINRLLIGNTFCVLDGKLLLDPCKIEEQIQGGIDGTGRLVTIPTAIFTIVIDHELQFCSHLKFGGSSIPYNLLKEAHQIAKKESTAVLSLLNSL